MNLRALYRVTRHVPPGQLLRYLFVGAWNTAFGYASFALLTWLLEGRMPASYLAASLLSSLINITVSFLGYKWIVFKTRGNYWREWLRCFMVYGGSIGLSLILLAPTVWLVELVTGRSRSAPYLAGAVLMVGQVVLSFIGHKNFSFKTLVAEGAAPTDAGTLDPNIAIRTSDKEAAATGCMQSLGERWATVCGSIRSVVELRAAFTAKDAMSIDQRVKFRLCLMLAVAVFTTASLLPLLASGYYSDDLVNSNLKGDIFTTDSSLIAFIFDAIKRWAVESGRVFVVGPIVTMPLYYFCQNPTAYKLAILALILLDVCLLFVVLELLTKDLFSACLGALIVVALFQFRLYHDPILSFSGLMQTLMAFFLCSVAAFSVYLTTGKAKYRYVSVAAFTLTLYIYEISLPLFFVFPLLAIRSTRLAAVVSATKAARPHLVSALLAVAINLTARASIKPTSVQYTGTTFNLDTFVIAKTFVKQLLSAFPLSYFFIDPSGVFHSNLHVNAATIIVTTSALLLFLYWLSTNSAYDPPSPSLLTIGLSLLALPALMISLSIKYQNELLFGLGYIPVYVQYFGFAMLAVWLLRSIQNVLKGCARSCFTAGIGILLVACSAINIQSNWNVVELANIESHYRRAALVEALQGGMLEGIKQGSIIVVSDQYSYNPYPDIHSPFRVWAEEGYEWKTAGLLNLYSGKRLIVVQKVADLASAESRYRSEHSASPDKYLLEIHSQPTRLHQKAGYVDLFSIDSPTPVPGGGGELSKSKISSTFSPQVEKE